jgi:hypothetical protein
MKKIIFFISLWVSIGPLIANPTIISISDSYKATPYLADNNFKPYQKAADQSNTNLYASVNELQDLLDLWQVTIHIIFTGGTPPDSALITLGDSSIWTNNGTAIFNLENGSYMLSVSAEGYYPFSGGQITVVNAPVTIEVQMYPVLYPVTFFANCCGEPLEGIMLTIGTETVITGADGLAAFNLTEGDYTVEINGYIFTFSVPETSYVDADICSKVTFHVINELGEPLEGATIDVNGEYLLTDATGEAFTCLQVGSYLYWAYMDGYLSQDGQFEVDTVAQTIELIMELPSYYSLTFHCYTACENQFNGWMLQINGDTLYSGETIYLPEGYWSFFDSWLGCWGGGWQGIDLVGPCIIYCAGLEEPHATFHIVSSQGGNLQGATVNVDTFALVTNNSGEAMFCLPGGNHPYTVSKEGYDTISGVFNYSDYCNDTIIDILINPVLVNVPVFSSFKLYPNPSSGKFYLETTKPGNDPIELQVMDLTSWIVYEWKQPIRETIEIDLSNQQKGMYFLHIKTEADYFTQKLIIQ